jgi:pyruvate ferredoxin oxidoreductase alpha subunit
MAMRGMSTPVETIIAGLGGRAILKDSLARAFERVTHDAIEDPHFLDLDWHAVRAELKRAASTRRSGPTAEHLRHAIRERASLSSAHLTVLPDEPEAVSQARGV